jgi:ribose transport system substrate-binding protein
MKTSLKTLLAAGVVMALPAMASAGEIAVIVKTTNSNFWQNVNKGASAAIAGQSEHTMTFDGPASESAIADQVNMVDNAVNRGVAGIVLAPSDPESLIPAVKRANESGIPVTIIDSVLGEGGDGTYQAFLSTDNCEAGKLAADKMIENVIGVMGGYLVSVFKLGFGPIEYLNRTFEFLETIERQGWRLHRVPASCRPACTRTAVVRRAGAHARHVAGSRTPSAPT